MRHGMGVVWVTGLSIAALALACGGNSGSTFSDPNGGDPNGGGNNGNLGSFSTDPVGTNAACVTNTANAGLAPANLVFMYDKSGSMGDPAEGGDPNIKWIPLSTGMGAFFTDPQSGGINASLQFFPAPGDLTTTCGAPYATPKVALTAQTAQLVTTINATQPQGGTPTLPALQGAVTYAAQIASQHPSDKTAIVLVTDGLPGFYQNGQQIEGCTNNDVAHVAAAAAAAYAAKPSVPTYVIGVGPALDNLNAIAVAGGTAHAYMVSVSDPTSTKNDLLAALNTVRAATVSCDFDMPAAPDGQQIDVNHVNVAYITNNQETVLTYSADCSNASGWHYDNITAPTRIEMCPTSCSQIQADRSGQLKIAFGCQTKGITK